MWKAADSRDFVEGHRRLPRIASSSGDLRPHATSPHCANQNLAAPTSIILSRPKFKTRN